MLIPNPREQLITEQWAAPAVATWKAVAELFAVGIPALPGDTAGVPAGRSGLERPAGLARGRAVG
jgi:hypothetical protein